MFDVMIKPNVSPSKINNLYPTYTPAGIKPGAELAWNFGHSLREAL
jgi:hypothetical protein